MSVKLLQGNCLSVVQTQSEQEFRAEVVRFADKLGFNFVNSMWVVDKLQGPPDLSRVSNMPSSLTDRSFDSKVLRDPVLQHCKRSALPFIWNRDTYADAGALDLWEEQAAYGYCTGVATAIHLPQGRHFMLNVDRDQALAESPEELTRIVAELQLFSVHAMDAASRVFTPTEAPGDELRLTPREREALSWTMEGKTAWEVGAILNISERTAVLHLQSAMHKLGCASKHQAVLKALRCGLIR